MDPSRRLTITFSRHYASRNLSIQTLTGFSRLTAIQHCDVPFSLGEYALVYVHTGRTAIQVSFKVLQVCVIAQRLKWCVQSKLFSFQA